jgi:hypothetical protein
MIKKASVFALALTLPLFGCSGSDDDGDSTTGADGSGDGSGSMTSGPGTGGDTAADDTAGTGPMGGDLVEGEACTEHEECMSLLCELYTDITANQMGVCGPAVPGGNTRVTATVRDFATGAVVGGAEIVVASALNAATNPTGVTPILTTTASGEGVVDATSEMPISAQIGIVALVSAGGGYLTATGLASPNSGGGYDPGVGIHDIWSVQQADLDAWSTALGMDPMIDAASLPLGDAGGVMGLLRDGATGTPVEGATVVSANDSSAAIVRYLADDGSFGTDATGPSGIFVILDPSLAEEFTPMMGGAAIGGNGTAGSAAGAAFTLVLNVTP